MWKWAGLGVGVRTIHATVCIIMMIMYGCNASSVENHAPREVYCQITWGKPRYLSDDVRPFFGM